MTEPRPEWRAALDAAEAAIAAQAGMELRERPEQAVDAAL